MDKLAAVGYCNCPISPPPPSLLDLEYHDALSEESINV